MIREISRQGKLCAWPGSRQDRQIAANLALKSDAYETDAVKTLSPRNL
jgi:hypothetical protein